MSDEILMKCRGGLFSGAAFAVLIAGTLGTSVPAVAVTCDSVTNPAGGAAGASDGGNVNATACGSNATASSSQSTAIGGSAQATGLNSAAVGTQAVASGLNATAMGAFANSSPHGTAVGYSSSASASAVAIGVTSNAGGASAVALGPSAIANFANSTAVGGGATTTRANQQSFGTAANTYTMSGLTSAASLAAQTGPTSLVTTDAAGNLAAAGFSAADISGLQNSVSGLQNSVSTLQGNVAALQGQVGANLIEARRGIAAAVATASAPMPSAPGKTSWQVRGSTFQSQTGFGFGFAHRLHTSMPLSIVGGYGNGGGTQHTAYVGMGGEF